MTSSGFFAKKTPFNLTIFSELQGGKEILDRSAFLKMANERIDQLDIPSAIENIIHFVRDQEAIQRSWSKDFFHHWIETIQTTIID